MRKLNSHTILQLWCCCHVMYNFCILALGSGQRLLYRLGSGRGSLVAKNRRSILLAMCTICLARFNRFNLPAVGGLAVRPPSMSTLVCTCRCGARRHRRRPSNPMFFDACRPSVVRWDRGKYGEYTRRSYGRADDRL